MSQSREAKEVLAQGFKEALTNVDLFLKYTEQGCPVWHSNDDLVVPIEKAVADLHERAGDAMPKFQYNSHTITEAGFLLQAQFTIGGADQSTTVHVVQIVEIGDSGKAVKVEEYVGFPAVVQF